MLLAAVCRAIGWGFCLKDSLVPAMQLIAHSTIPSVLSVVAMSIVSAKVI